VIAAALLAAGASRRLGTPKQLLQVNGRSFVRHAAECARDAELRVAVVVGHAASAVVDSLGGLEVETLENPRWNEGIASSVRVAVSWAESSKFEALLILVSDQPYLQATHLERLCACYRERECLVASAYAGTLGVPALFPARYYACLASLQGDRGAASLLRNASDVASVEWPLGVFDVDTKALAAAFWPGVATV